MVGPGLGGVSGSPDRAYHPRPTATHADDRLDGVPLAVWVPETHCACDLLVRDGHGRWHSRVGGVAAGVSDHVSAGGWMVLLARSDAANNAEITALPLTLERRHRSGSPITHEALIPPACRCFCTAGLHASKRERVLPNAGGWRRS